MNRNEVAEHLGIAPEAVRSTMRRYGINEQRGYPRDQVLNLERKQPSRRKGPGAEVVAPGVTTPSGSPDGTRDETTEESQP